MRDIGRPFRVASEAELLKRELDPGSWLLAAAAANTEIGVIYASPATGHVRGINPRREKCALQAATAVSNFVSLSLQLSTSVLPRI